MATDRCQPIRDMIDALEKEIRDTEDILPETIGPLRKHLEAFIRSEKSHVKQLRVALKVCEIKH